MILESTFQRTNLSSTLAINRTKLIFAFNMLEWKTGGKALQIGKTDTNIFAAYDVPLTAALLRHPNTV